MIGMWKPDTISETAGGTGRLRRIPYDTQNMVVFNKQQEPAGTILDIFKKDWNSSGLNRSPGKYEKEYDSYCAECEGEYVPFKFLWRYKVDKHT